jgi:hypothetical protein
MSALDFLTDKIPECGEQEGPEEREPGPGQRGWLDLVPRAVLRLAARQLDEAQRETIYQEKCFQTSSTSCAEPSLVPSHALSRAFASPSASSGPPVASPVSTAQRRGNKPRRLSRSNDGDPGWRIGTTQHRCSPACGMTCTYVM